MNTPLPPITDPGRLAASTLLLQPDEFLDSVRAELVEASTQQEALASYELSKSRGNRDRGLELLDKLNTHFQTAA